MTDNANNNQESIFAGPATMHFVAVPKTMSQAELEQASSNFDDAMRQLVEQFREKPPLDETAH